MGVGIQVAGQPVGKVFISYSHDSPDHSERVLALSNRLLALGIDVELDRYHIRPSQGWPHWCEEQLRPETSSFVLVICTPTYRARVENRVGADEGRGVYWEGAIVYNYLCNAKGNSRFIPVLLDDAPEAAIPMPLDGYTRYRVRAFQLDDPDFEALYRELTGQAETPKPALGKVIRLSARSTRIAAKALPEKEAVTDFTSDGGLLEESAAREPSPSKAEAVETFPTRGSFWSAFSNEESVEREEIRFWAIMETVAAIAVFWWIAIRYETFLLLTTSLFVAPLLLLRSDESTRLGAKWLDAGMFPLWRHHARLAREEVRRRWMGSWLWIAAPTGIVVGVGLGYSAAKLYLLGQQGWSAFGRGAGIALSISWLAGAVEGTRMMIREGARNPPEGMAVGTAAAAAAAMGGVGASMALAGAGMEAIAGGVVVAACSAVAVAAVAATVNRPHRGNDIIWFPLMVMSVFLGLWFTTLIFRFAATARHARDGYRHLPTNVRRLALCMTPLQQPELLPGLPSSHDLRFNVFLRDMLSEITSSDFTDRLISVTTAIPAAIIFVPAWAYRFILKSTLWFWWILFVVGGAPRLDGGIEGLRADAYRKAWPWVGIATSLLSLAAFSVNWLAMPLAQNVFVGPKLPMAVALLVLVKWKAIPIVTYIAIVSVLTTFAVGFWTQAVYEDARNPLRANRVAAQLPWLGYLIKWKSGFGTAGIALLMLYFALYANAVHHYLPVSDWAAGWLQRLYGPAAEPLRPA
jgi:TIR domain